MFRSIMIAASIATSTVCLGADMEVSALDRDASGAAQAQTATAPSPRAILQTYDPSNAFDGYWYPQRAADGREDR